MNVETDLSVISEAEKEIAKIKPYLMLTINGLDDADGIERVHKARMEVKSLRVGVEKSRKDLKDRVLKVGREIDAEAKRIVGMIEPIEQHLIDQESIVKNEKERLANVERERKEKQTRERMAALAAVGVMMTAYDVQSIPDDAFDQKLIAATVEFEAKKRAEEEETKRRNEEYARLQQMRVEQEAEAARLKQEREKQEAQLKAEQAKADAEQRLIRDQMAAEQRKLDQQRQEIERQEFERQANILAEQKAKERVERERKEKEEAEKRAKEQAELNRLAEIEAAKEAELRKSDSQKLIDIAQAILATRQGITTRLATKSATSVKNAALKLLDEAVQLLKKGA